MADIQIPMTSSNGVRLQTSEKYCENDIAVIPELEELTVTENGEYTPIKVGYNKVMVEVERPQLNAPALTLDGDILTIVPDVDNGAFATSYDLYIDGFLSGNYTSTTIDLTTLGLAEGAFAVTAVAKGINFIDSAVSASIWYFTAESCILFGSPSSFTLNIINNTKYWDGTLEYSTDMTTWNEWDGTTTLSADNGLLYMRGTGNTYITGSKGSYSRACWVLTGSDISCNGNIETLLDYTTVANGEHPTMADYCYSAMFFNCTNLTTAPELPATTLTAYCYRNMFNGCTNLTTTPPELPATTLKDYCYDSMFSACTSLTSAPALPATTLSPYCYNSMFSACTSLTTTPELPATTLASACYQYMFSGCRSLTTAPPELPATTLPMYCYRWMFDGCSKIKLSAEQTDEYTTAYRIPTSGTGTAGFNALTDMFRGTGGTFTDTPEIDTTYYLHSSNSVV